MTVLKRLSEHRSADDALANAIISHRFSGASTYVDGPAALAHSAVYAAVNLISDAVSTLPVGTYETRGDIKYKVDSPEIVSNPSFWMSDVDWRRQIMTSWLEAGNFFGLIVERDKRTMLPSKIDPLDPFDCQAYEDAKTYRLKFRIAGKEVNPDQIFHRPGLLLPGSRIGVTPISFAKYQIALGLNAQAYGRDYYVNGVKANGILNVPGKPTQEQTEEIKQKFIAAASTAHEPVVLGGDTKWQDLTVKAQDTMYLESINASGQDISRFFLLAPEMIGLESGSSMTYSNIEGRSRHFRDYTLNPWLVRMEKLHDTLTPPNQYTKVNRDAALSIDTMTRYNAHQIAIRAGIKSVNEIRALEELPPIPDRDTPLWPPYAFGQVGQEKPVGQQ